MLVSYIAFSAFEAMSLVLQPDSIKRLAFYALRSLFMFVAFGMIFVCYRKSKPLARKSFYARYGRFLIVMAVLTVFVLIEDVRVLGLNIGRIEAGPLRFDGSLYVEGVPLSKAAVDVDDKVVASVLAVVLGDTLHAQMLVELPIGAVVGHEEEAFAAKFAHMFARDLD